MDGRDTFSPAMCIIVPIRVVRETSWPRAIAVTTANHIFGLRLPTEGDRPGIFLLELLPNLDC